MYLRQYISNNNIKHTSVARLWPISFLMGMGEPSCFLVRIHGKIRCEIWIWIRISELIITPHPAALSAPSNIQWNQKTPGWEEEEKGRKEEGKKEKKGAKSQEINPWFGITCAQITSSTPPTPKEIWFLNVSRLHWVIPEPLNTHTKAPLLILCTPHPHNAAGQVYT